MKIQTLFLFALVAVVATFAQQPDEPIAKIGMIDVYSMDATKYTGVKFIYNNLYTYNPEAPLLTPPFPYADGRVRDGKYKASQTAMDKYLKDFAKKYNGKIFSVVKFEQTTTGMPAVVFACENGDTLYYSAVTYIGAEFTSKDLLDKEKKRIGSRFFFNNESYNQSFKDHILKQPTAIRSYAFKNVKTQQYDVFFPVMSEWKILDVSIDTAYFGVHSIINDGNNANISRVKYTIENKIYGKYEAYLQEQAMKLFTKEKLNDDFSFDLRMIIEESTFSENDLQNLKAWAAKGDDASIYLLAKIQEDKDRKQNKSTNSSPYKDKGISETIIKCAQKGYIYAVSDAASAHNVSIEDKFKFIDAAKKRYGNSNAFEKLFVKISVSTYNYIDEIRNASSTDDFIAVYEKMVKEYTYIEKKGITSFEMWNQPKDVKKELEEVQKKLDKLKQKKSWKKKLNF